MQQQIMKKSVNLFWFRRDLRLEDNAGLYHALRSGRPVVPIFIFDRNILDKLEDKNDARVAFIRQQLLLIQQSLHMQAASLEVYYGFPQDIFTGLVEKYSVGTVFTNHDYEAYARSRDAEIGEYLKKAGVGFRTYKDHVIFEKTEVSKDNGEPYSVFTPYSRKWLARLNDFYLKAYLVSKYRTNFYRQEAFAIPSLQEMGFEEGTYGIPSADWQEELIRHYDKSRDFPGQEGTSRLGIHLRFGTLSIREAARQAMDLNKVFLGELIWRDFYQMILWNHPEIGEGHAFKPAYERIRWRNDEHDFALWCEGRTGYPIVDAGMRQLNNTGFMHNRVRMIVASFLCKHLLIDWRWGEAYFAAKLLDFEFASNNGGWQWASGSGCDAAPYFRVFNPALQTKKFDRQADYIRAWVPEYKGSDYPEPMVNHEAARERCLKIYREALRRQ